MQDKRTQCKKITSPRGARVTEIEWGDGHKSTYPHEILRGYCPCASCQGHSGTISFVPTVGDALEIDQMQAVGNYAIQLDWWDGHNSGLYSYKYLRALCQCSECSSKSPLDDRPPLVRI